MIRDEIGKLITKSRIYQGIHRVVSLYDDNPEFYRALISSGIPRVLRSVKVRKSSSNPRHSFIFALSKIRSKGFQSLRAWSRHRAVPASAPEATVE